MALVFSRQGFSLVLESDRVALLRGGEELARAAVNAGTRAETPWRALGRAVGELFAARAHRRGDRGDIDVVLGAGLCHLALARGDASALSAGEAAAVARECLRLCAGNGGPDLEYRATLVKGEAGGMHLLCAALEAEAIEELRTVLAGTAWSLGAIRPRLVKFAADEALDGFSGHVLCANRHSAVLASLRSGAWLQVMTRRLPEDAEARGAVLGEVLKQAEALAATGSTEVWWLADAPAAAHAAAWRLKRPPDGMAAR